MRYFVITKRHLTVAVSLILGAVIVFVGAFSYEAFAKGERKVPIYCVESDKKTVAFSFDAAWGNT